MTLRFIPPKSHLTTYHDNNNFVVQFILFELIHADPLIHKIELFISEMKPSPSEKLTKKDRKRLDAVTTFLTRLGGYTKRDMQIFTWNLNDGILAKLKNYCSFFASNSKDLDADVMALQRNADRAWINCIESIHHIRAIQQNSPDTNPHPANLITGLEKLVNRWHRLKKNAAKICHQFRSDENVLFFILSHQEQLDQLYKTDFVAKFFNKIFLGDLSKAEKFIIRKYTRRGFDHLTPFISERISSLEMALV